MPRFSIFVAPIFALFSSDFYRDVGRNWRGKAFLYLLLLELVCWIPGIVMMTTAINKFVAEEADKLTDQIPPISINKGVAEVKAEQPHYIRLGDPPQIVAILDTTGQVKSLEGTTAHLLLTKHELIVKKNERETQHHDLKEADGVEFDGPTVRGWADKLAVWAPFVFYPLMVFLVFIGRILQALLYSLIGLVLAAMMKPKINYGGILAICLTSLTAPILLGTLLELTHVPLPASGLIGFALAIGYVAFGLAANRDLFTDESLLSPQGFPERQIP